MQNGPKMKWTFMSLQILDDVRQGKMTFAEMFPRARAAGFVAYDASDMDAEFASREEVLALCRDAGLRIADYIHWVHMTDPDEAGVQAAIESGKQAVHTALAHGTHYAGSTSCSYAESHTALLYVRAADVELDGRNLVESVDAGGTFCIVVG